VALPRSGSPARTTGTKARSKPGRKSPSRSPERDTDQEKSPVRRGPPKVTLDDEEDLLNYSELSVAVDVNRLVRDTLIPRNSRLRLDLNMKLRDDPMMRQVQLIEKITLRSELLKLSAFAQELKLENLKLGAKLAAADSSHDVTLKVVNSKVEIVNKGLFEHDDSELLAAAAAAAAASPTSSSPTRRKRQPWVPEEMDDTFSPFEEDEIIEDQWNVLANEVILEFVYDGVLIESGEEVQREILGKVPPPPRRHSSISGKGSPLRRDSVKLSLNFKADSATDKLAQLSNLPTFMQPLETLESKRSAGLKKRQVEQNKLEFLMSPLKSTVAAGGSSMQSLTLSSSSSSSSSSASASTSPPLPPQRTPTFDSSGRALAPAPVPSIRSSHALLSKKRDDDWNHLMQVGYGCQGQGERPSFMQNVSLGLAATSEGRTKAVLEGMLGRSANSITSATASGGGGGGGGGGNHSLSTDMASRMVKELHNLEKLLGVRSRNASIHYSSARTSFDDK